MAVAFGELDTAWALALRSPCPAAFAWRLLSRAVTRQVPAPPRRAVRPSPAAEEPLADAVLLRDGLGMSIEETAALMGTDGPCVRALLRKAERVSEPATASPPVSTLDPPICGSRHRSRGRLVFLAPRSGDWSRSRGLPTMGHFVSSGILWPRHQGDRWPAEQTRRPMLLM
ncbi:hypothetical protein GCM10009544_56980 [Streptomyces stramineus]|uniref:RNA polymerase sigma factor 70 region 4 type 2 domain-containing protein n=1 Tax=Streptomyces stramineus TaxID=173861 RepID=A0ABP3KWE5_9ACTN